MSLGAYFASAPHQPSYGSHEAAKRVHRQVKSAGHRHEKFRAYFPENDSENDEAAGDSNGPDLLALGGYDVASLIAYVDPQFYNTCTAVSLARAEKLSSGKNPLYIHYSVLRL